MKVRLKWKRWRDHLSLFSSSWLFALGLLVLFGASLFVRSPNPSPSAKNAQEKPQTRAHQVLNVRLPTNPRALNPLLSEDKYSTYIIYDWIFLPLLGLDLSNLQYYPGLAASVDISPDRTTYTYRLRRSSRWQDGSPVTTQDIQFTFDKLMDPNVAAAMRRIHWQGVQLEVHDEYSFSFKINKPRFDTFYQLNSFRPIQKLQFQGENDFNKSRGIINPIGNGPYSLKSYSPDDKLILQKVPNWWGGAFPYFRERYKIEQIIFRIINDNLLAYERFISGELDIFHFDSSGLDLFVHRVLGQDKNRFMGQAESTIDTAQSSNPAKTSQPQFFWKRIHNKAPRAYTYVAWNQRNPLFASQITRQALAHIIDIRQIISRVGYGFMVQSVSPFGINSPNTAPELKNPSQRIDHNFSLGLKLLRQEGWSDTDKNNILDRRLSNGEKIEFRFELKYNANNLARQKIAEMIKENLKNAGIAVDIRPIEWNAMLSDMGERKFDALIMSWGNLIIFPNARQNWHSKSGPDGQPNLVAYSNSEVDSLIEKSDLELDPIRRAHLMQAINRHLYHDQPFLWLMEPDSMLVAFNRRVHAKIWSLPYAQDLPLELYQVYE